MHKPTVWITVTSWLLHQMDLVWRASPFSLIVQHCVRERVWYNCYTGFVHDLTLGASNQSAEHATNSCVMHTLKRNITYECDYNCSGRIYMVYRA